VLGVLQEVALEVTASLPCNQRQRRLSRLA